MAAQECCAEHGTMGYGRKDPWCRNESRVISTVVVSTHMLHVVTVRSRQNNINSCIFGRAKKIEKLVETPSSSKRGRESSFKDELPSDVN
eukprot:scaffold195447_cov32-Attheya_sp.AAC.2